jgi:hypothetical protein
MELFSFQPHNPTGEVKRVVTYYYPKTPATDKEFFFIGVFGDDKEISNKIIYPNQDNHSWKENNILDFDQLLKFDILECVLDVELGNGDNGYRYHRAIINDNEYQFMILNTETYPAFEKEFMGDMKNKGFTFTNEKCEYIYGYLLKTLCANQANESHALTLIELCENKSLPPLTIEKIKENATYQKQEFIINEMLFINNKLTKQLDFALDAYDFYNIVTINNINYNVYTTR